MFYSVTAITMDFNNKIKEEFVKHKSNLLRNG